MRPKQRVHFFTLLEMMIAFALVSILVATLMGFYWQLTKMQSEGQQLRQEAFQARYLQSRLAEVLTHAVVTDNKQFPDTFFFISQLGELNVYAPGSLVFSYNHGLDLNPKFCNEVLARLYRVESEGRGQLWLATWPRPSCSSDPKLVRRELLMDNVDSLSFSLYEPPQQEALSPETPGQTLTPGIDLPSYDKWQEIWPITYEDVPALVKLTLRLAKRPNESEGRELTYYFPLPHSEKPIILEL